MAVSSASKHEIESPTALTLLIEAERRWRDALAETDRECAAVLGRTREAIERAARQEERELATLVDQRRRELSREVDDRVANVRASASSRAAKLRTLDDAALDTLTDLVLERVTWSDAER